MSSCSQAAQLERKTVTELEVVDTTQAYMMWIVMKYIEIIIAYGDFHFRQNTLETIPMAIQMYIFASHLWSPRTEDPKANKDQAQDVQ